MKQYNLTDDQLSVVNAISEKPLTSFEILKKVDTISMILSLYNIMDDLKDRGIVKSFVKENTKYHYAA
ncbi:hypothetical protein [Polaribacter porphyrae]|uniref:Transcriptional regulator n=1 Tax=Polaribacter porphyrae TaxID=1137780 RepID=A0A2S7WM17_9FLAO|nr:hypothetical protein [Polaribacter porphyrae]PQJ78331.1 hypothetical protein BTO18_03610 [Polaribacter porphyrae]